MSHNVIEADEFTATVPVTDVDDTTYPGTEAQMGQNLANRTRYHENTLTGNYVGTGFQLSTEPAEYNDVIPHPGNRLGNANPWTFGMRYMVRNFQWLRQFVPGSSAPGATQPYTSPVVASGILLGTKWVAGSDGTKIWWGQATTDTPQLWWPLLALPRNAWLKSLTVWVGAIPGQTHSTVPSTKPTITLYRQLGSSSASLGSATDSSADTASYDATHAITITSLNEFIQQGVAYNVKLTGEGGTGALADTFAVYLCAATVSSST